MVRYSVVSCMRMRMRARVRVLVIYRFTFHQSVKRCAQTKLRPLRRV